MFFDYSNDEKNRERNPDLSFNSIDGCAVESFDSKMLLDPFEKKFDLPTAFIELSNSQRW
jgi:hypothetical protein